MGLSEMTAVAATMQSVGIKGFSWTTYGVWALVGLLITGWFKFRPTMRKLQIEEDSSLRTDLMRRVSELEAGAATMMREHATEVAGLKAEMAEQRRDCDKEQAALRAQIKSVTDMLMLVVEGRVTELSPMALKAAASVDHIHKERES